MQPDQQPTVECPRCGMSVRFYQSSRILITHRTGPSVPICRGSGLVADQPVLTETTSH